MNTPKKVYVCFYEDGTPMRVSEKKECDSCISGKCCYNSLLVRPMKNDCSAEEYIKQEETL